MSNNNKTDVSQISKIQSAKDTSKNMPNSKPGKK